LKNYLRLLLTFVSSLIYQQVSSIVPLPRGSISPQKPQLLLGPVADRFFAIGALAAFFGGAGLGVTLWLMLNGYLLVRPSYAAMREMHAVIQFYLFFGLFITGFLIQVAPRMLKLSVRPSRSAFLLSILLIVAGILEILAPFAVWPRLFLFIPFVVLFFALADLVVSAAPEERSLLGIWMMISIGSFAAGSFSSLSNPDVALAFFWFAIGSISLATGRQFIVGFLDGRRMTSPENTMLLGLFSLTGLFFLANVFWPQSIFLQLSGICAAFTLGSYLWWMRLGSAPRRLFSIAIGYSFAFAALWMILGAVSLCFFKIADVALHLWSIGWATSLVFGVSAQMLRNLTGSFLLSDGAMRCLILLWQVVPAVRASGRIWGQAYAFPLVVAFSATIVLVIWGGAVIFSSLSLVLRTRRAKAMA